MSTTDVMFELLFARTAELFDRCSTTLHKAKTREFADYGTGELSVRRDRDANEKRFYTRFVKKRKSLEKQKEAQQRENLLLKQQLVGLLKLQDEAIREVNNLSSFEKQPAVYDGVELVFTTYDLNDWENSLRKLHGLICFVSVFEVEQISL